MVVAWAIQGQPQVKHVGSINLVIVIW